ncbi:hypothetical protein TSUD_15250 [Trifolium subterraneum]|uniref:Uncharacterized protein n=1 Tax=Trifolium subterraneum TaxID=3900 RepID=A0A2Z6NDY5_TRISU|nr:hypothetical protein TSUD_15250 [Trifolium subterraneum]
MEKGLTLAPLVVKINPIVNLIFTACITVFVGCYRSVKPTLPSETMSKEYAMRIPFVAILEIQFTKSQVIVGIPETLFCGWFALQKHWLANNILGLALSIRGIERLSLGSFKTGAILLVGFFFYDIFWVFFTPVMRSVGISLDVPIKLMFPTSNSARPFWMLGLGDIVTPGYFVALALRFDISRGKRPQYFKSAFLGYIVGLAVTIVVANWFQAGQVTAPDR